MADCFRTLVTLLNDADAGKAARLMQAMNEEHGKIGIAGLRRAWTRQ